MALKIVELIPSATSNSPFSLGRVKLLSLPDPNILKITTSAGGYAPASNLGLTDAKRRGSCYRRTATACGRRLPSQHGVGLGGEDGRIDHKSGVVHDQSDSFCEPQATAVAVFAAQVVHVDGIAQSL